jgi:hypothetical protein
MIFNFQEPHVISKTPGAGLRAASYLICGPMAKLEISSVPASVSSTSVAPDPESEDREWIAQAWLDLIRKALGIPGESLAFEHQLAVGHVTITSPAMMQPFDRLNEGKRYNDKIKPFNFLLSCHVKPFGHPPGVDPKRFHLIAPYGYDSRRWLKQVWTDPLGRLVVGALRQQIRRTSRRNDRSTSNCW